MPVIHSRAGQNLLAAETVVTVHLCQLHRAAELRRHLLQMSICTRSGISCLPSYNMLAGARGHLAAGGGCV